MKYLNHITVEKSVILKANFKEKILSQILVCFSNNKNHHIPIEHFI